MKLHHFIRNLDIYAAFREKAIDEYQEFLDVNGYLRDVK